MDLREKDFRHNQQFHDGRRNVLSILQRRSSRPIDNQLETTKGLTFQRANFTSETQKRSAFRIRCCSLNSELLKTETATEITIWRVHRKGTGRFHWQSRCHFPLIKRCTSFAASDSFEDSSKSLPTGTRLF